MATIVQLARRGTVEKYDIELGFREFEGRFAYATPEMCDWFNDTLPTLQSFYAEADLDPAQQAYDQLRGFCTNRSMDPVVDLHVLTPHDRGVWELKTLDLRMFGWFPEKDHFVIAKVETFEAVKNEEWRYELAIAETVAVRDQMALDEPKFVPGDTLNDVLSNPY